MEASRTMHLLHLTAGFSMLRQGGFERDMKELAPSSIGGAREEERISIAINADSIATWALGALNELAVQGLPMEIITDDQDFTQEWLRSGHVLGCVTTLKQALRGCKVAAGCDELRRSGRARLCARARAQRPHAAQLP